MEPAAFPFRLVTLVLKFAYCVEKLFKGGGNAIEFPVQRTWTQNAIDFRKTLVDSYPELCISSEDERDRMEDVWLKLD
jgi:hypothetical protein